MDYGKLEYYIQCGKMFILSAEVPVLKILTYVNKQNKYFQAQKTTIFLFIPHNY